MDFMTEMFYEFQTSDPQTYPDPSKDPDATRTVKEDYVVQRNGSEYGRISLTSVAASTISTYTNLDGDQIKFPDWRYVPKYTNTSEKTQLVTLGIHPNNIINGTLWYTNVNKNGSVSENFFAPMTPYQVMLIKPLSSSPTVPSDELNGEFGILFQREISSFAWNQLTGYGMHDFSYPTAFLDLEKSDSISSYWYVFRYHYPTPGYSKKDSIAGPGQPVLLSSGESVFFYQPHFGNGSQFQKDISASYPFVTIGDNNVAWPGYLSMDLMQISSASATRKNITVSM